MPRHKATARPKVKAAVERVSPKPKHPAVVKTDRQVVAKKQNVITDWLAGDLRVNSGDYMDAHDLFEVIDEIRLNPHFLGVANALKRGMARYDLDAGYSIKKRLNAEELEGLSARQKELASALFSHLIELSHKVHKLNSTISCVDEIIAEVRGTLEEFASGGEKNAPVMGPMAWHYPAK